jgi:hypothetical protein
MKPCLEISMAVLAVGLISARFIAVLARYSLLRLIAHLVRPSAHPSKHMNRKWVTKLKPECAELTR